MTEIPLAECDIPIGTKYMDRKGRECTVIDVYKTFNMTNTLIRTRYVVQYLFAGMWLKDRDVVKVTIQKALMLQDN